jgi:Holliday junction resolvase
MSSGEGQEMNTKRKGSRNEHKPIRILEVAGYHCTRAAGSLGLFDIIAVSHQGIRLVQVKSNRNAPPAEREAIEEFKGIPENASKEIWIFEDYARFPVINEIR